MDLSTLGPAGAAVAIVFLFLKFLKESMGHLTASINRQVAASESQKKSSDEVLKFMKNLNGELKKAAQKKLDA